MPAGILRTRQWESRGVRKLFDWQARCLRVDDGKPLSGGNLVYRWGWVGGVLWPLSQGHVSLRSLFTISRELFVPAVRTVVIAVVMASVSRTMVAG